MDDIAVHQEKAKERFAEKSAVIDIVFEDENILIVNKPVGLLTHPDKESDRDTLIDRVQYYLRKMPGTKGMTFAPSACNRLDRNTAGLVIIAKNYATLRLVNKMIRERKISKYYLCIVKGMVKKDGEIKEALVKDERRNKTRVGRAGDDDARDSHTIYKVLMRNNNYSLLEVELVTGRPHQIRAHFSSIGYPLYGDVKYGGSREAMDSQFLFAYKIHFKEGEDHLIYLNDKSIQCPLPKEFEEVMTKLFDKGRDTVKPGSRVHERDGGPGNRNSSGPRPKGEPRVEGQRNGSGKMETERPHSHGPRKDHGKGRPHNNNGPKRDNVKPEKERSLANEQPTDREAENADNRTPRTNGGKPGFSPNHKNKKYYGDKNRKPGNHRNGPKKPADAPKEGANQ